MRHADPDVCDREQLHIDPGKVCQTLCDEKAGLSLAGEYAADVRGVQLDTIRNLHARESVTPDLNRGRNSARQTGNAA